MKKESATASPRALVDDVPAASHGAGQASPYKSAVEELDSLRKMLRLACQHYAKRIDMEIIRLRERIAGAGERQSVAAEKKSGATRHAERNTGMGHLHDLRDLTTLLRTLDVKPLAGRRKDLKKIEALVEELRLMIERWE